MRNVCACERCKAERCGANPSKERRDAKQTVSPVWPILREKASPHVG